jgi:hypothetical protein
VPPDLCAIASCLATLWMPDCLELKLDSVLESEAATEPVTVYRAQVKPREPDVPQPPAAKVENSRSTWLE